MAGRWYVIHTYSGQEARARQALLERVKAAGREAAIEEIFIPEETVVEVVKGERKTSKRKFLPGYILVRMALDDELWHIVRNTARITGFVGAGSKPTPIPTEDVERMIGQAKTTKPKPKVRFDCRVGQCRRCRDGQTQEQRTKTIAHSNFPPSADSFC